MSPDTTRRLARLFVALDEVSADDFTEDGTIAFDDSHTANSDQNKVGPVFNEAARRGWLENKDGRTRISRAPHRRGGRQQLWTVTDVGRQWAADYLEQGQLL